MVCETSCPYAPTFCTGVPPTLPGIPLRHSTPAQCTMTAWETKRSHDSPAPASKRIFPPSLWPGRCSMPGAAIFRTKPGQPLSATTRLLPPPRTKRGWFFDCAKLTASCTSAADFASTKKRAGPPRRKVVRGASGTFSWSSMDDFQYTQDEHFQEVRGSFDFATLRMTDALQ